MSMYNFHTMVQYWCWLVSPITAEALSMMTIAAIHMRHSLAHLMMRLAYYLPISHVAQRRHQRKVLIYNFLGIHTVYNFGLGTTSFRYSSLILLACTA